MTRYQSINNDLFYECDKKHHGPMSTCPSNRKSVCTLSAAVACRKSSSSEMGEGGGVIPKPKANAISSMPKSKTTLSEKTTLEKQAVT